MAIRMPIARSPSQAQWRIWQPVSFGHKDAHGFDDVTVDPRHETTSEDIDSSFTDWAGQGQGDIARRSSR
jgi:hypothetical protein